MEKVCSRILRTFGWRRDGDVPDISRALLVVGPHTSNWDLPILMLYRCSLKLRARYLAKHSLFWWPLGGLLRASGGIALDRSRGGDAVEQIVSLVDATPEILLAMAPEGTRSYRPHWKSGFYRIAHAAHLPLVLISLDYAKRCMRLSEPLMLSDDVAADMAIIRAFFSEVRGRYPHKQAPVLLPEEE